MMPSFLGSWEGAIREGQRCDPCAACGAWAWWLPSQDRAPLCSRRECEQGNREKRRAALNAANGPRPDRAER